MKNQIKSLLLVAFMLGTVIPAWGQASTQGKEFWVSSTLVCSPDKKAVMPYIAISAEQACTVSITGGVGNAINITQQLAAGSWNEFGNTSKASNTNPTSGFINVQMDASKWYPTTMLDASNIYTLAGQKNQYGLHITATENISVYVILSSPNSMDASNILPITAIGSEYYTQDYFPEANQSFEGNMVSMTTILGTENGTTVEIIPNGDTYDNHLSGQPYLITLNQGETYYLISKKERQLSGTHIRAKNGKKIAIYNGSALTRIPNGRAARDCIFEQSMPVEYWGTQFIVTRSLQKDGNIIGITATQNSTEIKVDGFTQTFINEGETYYILLQNASDPYTTSGTITSRIDKVIIADVAYIETSCPCAVYSYDTGRDFKGSAAGGTSEIVGHYGDPSSVWVSPIQQKIGKITFGTCYTTMTTDHFLNVVTETATCQSTTLTALYGATKLDKTNLLVWQPVPGNPKYSYARAKIGDSNTSQYSVFNLENTRGVIATVYGNGDDESYAYSAGSAAVEQGINVNGITFTDGYRSDEKFCFGDEIAFDANVGTDEITRVDWSFGDGTTEYLGPTSISHTYNSPGWYDVTAALYGHQVCTTESEMFLGSVTFSFRIVRPDTVFGDIVPKCIPLEDYKANPAYWDEKIANPEIDTVQEHCYDDVVLNYVIYNRETEEYKDTIVGRDMAIGYNGKTYYTSTDVVDTINYELPQCTQYIRYYVKVITCLDISVTNDPEARHACPGDNFNVIYTKTKGDIDGPAILKIQGMPDQQISISNNNVKDAPLEIPVEKITKPGIYKAQLIIKDEHCGDTKTFDIDFKIYYPSDIFAYKFNNVLAVYLPGYGGNTNYEFEAYQWYRNGVAIPGATYSIYHTDAPFNEGDTYYVELTDKNGLKLPSCPQRIETVPDYTPKTAPKAQKKLINHRIYIVLDERMYDAYGQRVQ